MRSQDAVKGDCRADEPSDGFRMILETLGVGCREHHLVGAVDHELYEPRIDFVQTRADQDSADADRVEEKVFPVHVGGGDGDRFWCFSMRKNDDVRAVCIENPIFGGFAVTWLHEARDDEPITRREVRIIGWADVEDHHAAASIHCEEGAASVDRR